MPIVLNVRVTRPDSRHAQIAWTETPHASRYVLDITDTTTGGVGKAWCVVVGAGASGYEFPPPLLQLGHEYEVAVKACKNCEVMTSDIHDTFGVTILAVDKTRFRAGRCLWENTQVVVHVTSSPKLLCFRHRSLKLDFCFRVLMKQLSVVLCPISAIM